MPNKSKLTEDDHFNIFIGLIVVYIIVMMYYFYVYNKTCNKPKCTNCYNENNTMDKPNSSTTIKVDNNTYSYTDSSMSNSTQFNPHPSVSDREEYSY